MKVLIIGSGGREHAIGWKVNQNSEVQKIYFAPGNAGTAGIGENISVSGIDNLADFAEQNSVDLTIVGPEAELSEGIVDVFEAKGLEVFGPDKKAAQLEASKTFAKDFMQKYGVKTAAYQNFTDATAALEYLQTQEFPIVVKASGLAAGKGVLICQDKTEAEAAVKDIMLDKAFGDAGAEVVIEEFLEGFEASILSVFNGKEIIPFITAKDHKKIGEGETGLNTGGMGVLAPNPHFTEEHFKAFENEILAPTLEGLLKEDLTFSGVIFFGLMINEKGIYLLEYNLRMGDPETQAVLPLLKSDLVDIIQKSNKGESFDLQWEDKKSCCVVMVSGGYPKAYEKGHVISGLENLEIPHFIAGAQLEDGKAQTSGGRVLNLVAIDDTLEKAHTKVYTEIEKVKFEKSHYRTDIGQL